MELNEIKKLKELVAEYNWLDGSLFVAVEYVDLKKFIDLLQEYFDDDYINDVHIYGNAAIGISNFDEILEYIGIDAKKIFIDENGYK